MRKAWTVVELLLVAIAVALPFPFNLLAMWLALACATAACIADVGKWYAATTWLGSLAILVLLSPLTLAFLLNAGGPAHPDAPRTLFVAITVISFAAPIAVMAWRALARARRASSAGDSISAS